MIASRVLFSFLCVLPSAVLCGESVAVPKTCLEPHTTALCLQATALALLDRIDSRDVPIMGDSVVLVKDPHAQPSSRSEDLTTRLTEFLKSRRLLLKIPQINLDNELVEGRKDKDNRYGATALMMGGTLLAMGFAALAALAGKALAASMAALMMAAMAAMKKHGGGGHSGYEVITVGGGGHHHRSLQIPPHEEEEVKYEDTSYNEPYNHESYPRNNK